MFDVTMGISSRIWGRFVDRNGADGPRFISSLYESIKNDMMSKVLTTGTFRGGEELYQIWRRTSGIEVELFSNSFSETGICVRFWSTLRSDSEFGGVGLWSSCRDAQWWSGGETAPLKGDIIDNVINNLEESILKERPHYRVAIWPLSSDFNVLKSALNGMLECLIVELTSSFVYEKRQQKPESICEGDEGNNEPIIYGMFVWVNYLDLTTKRPSQNI